MEGKITTYVPVRISSDPIHGSASETVIPVPVIDYWLEESSPKDQADKQGEPENKSK